MNTLTQSCGGVSGQGGEVLRAEGAEGGPDRAGAWFLAVVSVAMGLASLAAGWIMPIIEDDTFYLHTWWLYAQGYVAHRDFFYHGSPGIWLWLAPLAWLPWTPSAWVAFGRALVAVTFGASFWVIGRLTRAYRWEAVLLAGMALVFMIRTEWFMFRRAYFEALFLALHLGVLSRLGTTTRPGWIAGLAGWCVGMMCMISQRGAFYLHLQPIVMLWVFWGRWPLLGRAALGWVVGGVASALPTLAYLAYHNLWAEEWACMFVYPRTHYRGPGWLTLKTSVWILLGGVGILGVVYDRHLRRCQKQFLILAWLGVLVATMVSFAPFNYTETIFQLFTGGLFTVAIRAFLEFVSTRTQFQTLAGWGVAGLSWLAAWGLISYVFYPVPWRMARHVHQRQLTVLDWLAHVSNGEPVVVLEPYHPMLVPCATFFRSSFAYVDWLKNPFLRSRLNNIAREILESRPPMIPLHMPGPPIPREQDIITLLKNSEIITHVEVEQLSEMLEKDYVQIRFPEIEWTPIPSSPNVPGDKYRGSHYGDTFWIRRDRFEACPPPDIPHQVQRPTFPSAKPSAQTHPPSP